MCRTVRRGGPESRDVTAVHNGENRDGQMMRRLLVADGDERCTYCSVLLTHTVPARLSVIKLIKLDSRDVRKHATSIIRNVRTIGYAGARNTSGITSAPRRNRHRKAENTGTESTSAQGMQEGIYTWRYTQGREGGIYTGWYTRVVTVVYTWVVTVVYTRDGP